MKDQYAVWEKFDGKRSTYYDYCNAVYGANVKIGESDIADNKCIFRGALEECKALAATKPPSFQ